MNAAITPTAPTDSAQAWLAKFAEALAERDPQDIPWHDTLFVIRGVVVFGAKDQKLAIDWAPCSMGHRRAAMVTLATPTMTPTGTLI